MLSSFQGQNLMKLQTSSILRQILMARIFKRPSLRSRVKNSQVSMLVRSSHASWSILNKKLTSTYLLIWKLFKNITHCTIPSIQNFYKRVYNNSCGNWCSACPVAGARNGNSIFNQFICSRDIMEKPSLSTSCTSFIISLCLLFQPFLDYFCSFIRCTGSDKQERWTSHLILLTTACSVSLFQFGPVSLWRAGSQNNQHLFTCGI